MTKLKFTSLLAIFAITTRFSLAAYSTAGELKTGADCNALLQEASTPSPTPFLPLISSELASAMIKTVPKINDYSVLTLDLSNKVEAKIIVDSQAPWLMHALEKFTGHAASTTDQNEIRKFLDYLSKSDLVSIVNRQPEMYHGDLREARRDGAPYTLAEWITSRKRTDVSLALIGQSLFENFVKKETRIVVFQDGTNPSQSFGLLVQNRYPELLTPGKYESGETRSSVKVTRS